MVRSGGKEMERDGWKFKWKEECGWIVRWKDRWRRMSGRLDKRMGRVMGEGMSGRLDVEGYAEGWIKRCVEAWNGSIGLNGDRSMGG